jgi:hypothetical protein
VPAGADPEPIPASISPNDDGSTFTMSLGDTTDLVVADPLAPDPIVEGTSVELSEVTNVAESGVREWEVRSLERGVTTIMGGAQDWTVTIRVS